MLIYLATANNHKLEEIKGILTGAEIALFPCYDPSMAVESGSTFEENATIKAIALSKLTDSYVLADDSGLSADALGGAPGIYSHRYAHINATDKENNEYLLSQIPGNAPRTARFICVLALAKKGLLIKTFRGECEGTIAFEERGENGFGYDPLFVLPDGRSMAELTPEEKNRISHRSAALALLSDYLRKNRDTNSG
ncbi:MAG: RdgB/HAM1 family non-canonical purine NTP pyrophosphatase [Deferribacteraceae bacterium]|jgi:XTP/dITP diphosphohydrolase|nr:RdgB/HAM1 family non-canonical purine NTP pyrophosphatase [Deferribacteraceae bacterium]